MRTHLCFISGEASLPNSRSVLGALVFGSCLLLCQIITFFIVTASVCSVQLKSSAQLLSHHLRAVEDRNLYPGCPSQSLNQPAILHLDVLSMDGCPKHLFTHPRQTNGTSAPELLEGNYKDWAPEPITVYDLYTRERLEKFMNGYHMPGQHLLTHKKHESRTMLSAFEMSYWNKKRIQYSCFIYEDAML